MYILSGYETDFVIFSIFSRLKQRGCYVYHPLQ